MSIAHDDIGEVRIIRISGRLDVEGPDSVSEKLVELARDAKKGVVVDLTSLKFLASIGVRSLITGAKAVKSRGGKLVLVVDPASTVMMSVKATGMDHFIPVFDSVEKAQQAAA